MRTDRPRAPRNTPFSWRSFGARVSGNTHVCHAAFRKHILLNVLLVGLSAELLHHAPENAVAEVRVRPVSARFVPQWLLMDGQLDQVGLAYVTIKKHWIAVIGWASRRRYA